MSSLHRDGDTAGCRRGATPLASEAARRLLESAACARREVRNIPHIVVYHDAAGRVTTCSGPYRGVVEALHAAALEADELGELPVRYSVAPLFTCTGAAHDRPSE